MLLVLCKGIITNICVLRLIYYYLYNKIEFYFENTRNIKMFRNIALVGDGTTKLSCINFLNRNSVTKNNMWKRQTTVFYQNIQPTTNLGLIFFDNVNQHKIEQHIKDLKNVDADYLIMWPHNQDEQWLNC